MTAAQARCLLKFEAVVRMSDMIGCDCDQAGPLGPHEQGCHKERLHSMLALMRSNFGVGSPDDMGEVDPTPYCSGCGAMTSDQCKCGPIAEND